MRIRIAGFLALAGLAVGVGCASKQAAKPAPNHPVEVAKLNPAAPIPAKAAPDAIKMSQIREKALQVLEESASSSDGQVRGYAMDGSGMVPNRLGNLMLKGLDDPTPGVKAMAAVAAGKSRYQPAAGRVNSLLNDQSPFVRASAIYSLSKMGKPVDPSPLGSMLTNGETLQIRSQAAWVIGETGNRTALPMLREAAVEGTARARPIEVTIFQLQCAEARVKLGDTDPIEGIRAALFPARPEDFESAVLAVQIIGEIKDRGSMDQLIYLEQYKDARGNPMPAEFRLACATALAKLGLDRGSFIAEQYAQDANPTIRQQAASVFGYTARAEHFPELEAMMNDPSPMVRVVAASSVIRAHARLSGERLP